MGEMPDLEYDFTDIASGFGEQIRDFPATIIWIILS
jgi:hypothetical protein